MVIVKKMCQAQHTHVAERPELGAQIHTPMQKRGQYVNPPCHAEGL